jgi:hypothetical protein
MSSRLRLVDLVDLVDPVDPVELLWRGESWRDFSEI